MSISNKTSRSPESGPTSRKSPKARRHLRMAGVSITAGIAVLTAGIFTARAQTIPSNAQNTADVPAPMFAGWFESGTPTLNGVVNPADSLNFTNNPNIDFWRWSWQMFLWANSPAPASYGGGGHIFNSPAFFDVSPPAADGSRKLIPHQNGILRAFGLRLSKLGPHKLPVIMSKAHKLFEVVPTKLSTKGRPIITNGAGKQFEVSKITFGQDKKPMFLDLRGKPIVRPKALIKPTDLLRPRLPGRQARFMVQRRVDLSATVQKFMLGINPIFLDLFGNVIEVEQGEAGDKDVLMSQNHSFVYYATMVNDVYAYFLTGTKNGSIAANAGNSVVVGGVTVFKFPTNATGLGEVTTFASAHGVTFPDPNALAVELKTAWVDASTLPDPAHYIRMLAQVPTYNTADPNHWIPTGHINKTLALVGMHVVGSTFGHPEMIWSTFEHFGNDANTAYQYVNSMGTTVSGPIDPGPWTFAAPGASSFNVPHIHANTANGHLDSVGGFTISPSDTNRVNPWGVPGASAGVNTQIISIDHSVLTQLIAGDTRGNYFMTGSTWTIGGAAPNGGNEVGTNQSSNTTLETYAQGSNCFNCHLSTSGTSVSTTDVSHMFPDLKPLFP